MPPCRLSVRAYALVMSGFLIRTLATMLALWLASAIVPGVDVGGTVTLFLASILLGVVNAIVRPLMIVLTLPFTVVTLGLFLLVVNATMFGLTAWLLPGFVVSGFWPALFGSLVVSVTSTVVSWNIGSGVRREVVVVKR